MRQTRANDRVSDMITRYQIECEWQQNGYVMGASYRRHDEDDRGEGAGPITPWALERAFLIESEVEAVTGSRALSWRLVACRSRASQCARLCARTGTRRDLRRAVRSIRIRAVATVATRRVEDGRSTRPKAAVLADKVIFAYRRLYGWRLAEAWTRRSRSSGYLWRRHSHCAKIQRRSRPTAEYDHP